MAGRVRQSQPVCGRDVLARIPHRRRRGERDQVQREAKAARDGGGEIGWAVVELSAWRRRHGLASVWQIARAPPAARGVARGGPRDEWWGVESTEVWRETGAFTTEAGRCIASQACRRTRTVSEAELSPT